MLKMTIAEYIANQLFIHGVRYVFGIPGGPSIPYMEAFREAGIEFAQVRENTGVSRGVRARGAATPPPVASAISGRTAA